MFERAKEDSSSSVRYGPTRLFFENVLRVVRILLVELRFGSLPSLLRNLVTHSDLTTLQFRNGLRITIRVTVDDLRVLSDSVLMKEYGKPRAGDIVIDIGAYIGDFATYAGWCGATVFAYEPIPENYRIALLNIAQNELWKRVKVANVAVSDGPTAGRLISLKYDPKRPHLASIFDASKHSETISVLCTSLEQVFKGNELSRCDLLKLDCEGAEYDILLTAPHQILERIGAITMEYHPSRVHKVEQIVTRLRSTGFTVRLKPYPLKSRNEGGYLNAIRTELGSSSHQ